MDPVLKITYKHIFKRFYIYFQVVTDLLSTNMESTNPKIKTPNIDKERQQKCFVFYISYNVLCL